MADGTGEDCAACNAPCVLELNECTGLPGGGADGGDDAATTAAPTAATTATTAELDGITAGPSSSAVGGAPAPAVTASPAPQGGTTTAASPTTATPTAVCGADEEGCVDVDYVIRYCIPVSSGLCFADDCVVSSRRRLHDDVFSCHQLPTILLLVRLLSLLPRSPPLCYLPPRHRRGPAPARRA